MADLHEVMSRYPGDSELAAMVSALRAISQRFAARWEHPAVARHGGERKTVHKPVVGEITLDCDVLTVLRIIALAQGDAEHYLRGRRGIWDLDVIVCFAEDPRLSRLFRRMVVSWDWGPSKFGRCPYDPPEYTGRAVDIVFWVIPDRTSAVAALREWRSTRSETHQSGAA